MKVLLKKSNIQFEDYLIYANEDFFICIKKQNEVYKAFPLYPESELLNNKKCLIPRIFHFFQENEEDENEELKIIVAHEQFMIWDGFDIIMPLQQNSVSFFYKQFEAALLLNLIRNNYTTLNIVGLIESPSTVALVVSIVGQEVILLPEDNSIIRKGKHINLNGVYQWIEKYEIKPNKFDSIDSLDGCSYHSFYTSAQYLDHYKKMLPRDVIFRLKEIVSE